MIIYRSQFNLSVILVTLAILDFSNAFVCVTKSNNTIRTHEICDGIIDCRTRDEYDRKDESFALCHSRICEDESHFRCTYGGCLNRTLRCDGKPDCWDASDENKFECLEGANLEDAYQDLYGDCEKDQQFGCKEKCLEWSRVCDGRADCRDGIDEDAALCAALECEPPAFRCLYGGCVSPNALCNHILDCMDGSDEIEEICLKKNPTLTHDAQVKPTWTVRYCRLQELSNFLVAEDYVSNTTFPRNARVPDKTLVHLSCSNGHRLIGEEQNVCDGDTWRHPLARCVPQCRHTGSNLHTGQCTLDGSLIDCDQPMLPMGTRMKVSCADGYENEPPGLQFCHANGSWVALLELPKCEYICGKWELQDDKRSPPWLMSIFQRGHKAEFVLACHATILSPFILVATEYCFQNITISGVASTEPVLYTVAEGYPHIRSFMAHEPHPYKLHNVSFIHNVGAANGALEHSLALVQLLHPLEFGVRLRPVCVRDEDTDEWLHHADYSKQTLGEAIIDDRRAKGRYELREVINPRSKYHISAFLKDIVRDIAETQAKGNI